MGKKQSPFIGRRVPLVDNGVPILYARYNSVDEILSDKKRAAPEPDAEAAANGTEPHQPSAKKCKNDKQHESAAGVAAASKPQQEQQQQTATPDAVEAAADRQLSKKEKKKLKKQQKQQQEQQAAANGQATDHQQPQQQPQQQAPAVPEPKGNADEAARIRQVLGFTAAAAANGSSEAQPPATAAAPAPAAPQSLKLAGGFSFNFGNLSTEEAVAADTEAKLAAIQAVDGADKDGFVPRRVFVGGMPYSYSREQVEEYWGWCGEVQELDVMTFPDTGRFRGIAFITFKTQEGADAALACDGEQLDGQTLKVERCKAAAVAKTLKQSVASARSQQHQHQSQRGRQQQQQQQQPHAPAGAAGGGDAFAAGGGLAGPARMPGYNVAYVGNIAFEARPEDVSALFEACNVTKVRLHTDKDTRKSKGYAHVHFADEAGLEQAIGMSGTQLMGRAIKISYGQPKKA